MKLPKDDESLSHDEEDFERLMKQSHIETQEKLNPLINCVLTPLAHIWYIYNHQRTEFILGLILLCSVTLAITGIVEEIDHKLNPHINHHIDTDYDELNVNSRYNLKLGNVDHWCIDGTDDTCPYCSDPTEPAHHMDSKGWSMSYSRNVHLSKTVQNVTPNIDVVFLGDGLTEAKIGMKHGRPVTELQQTMKDFDTFFGVSNPKAKYSGAALGITSDTTKNLLWRIQEGEFQQLQPKIWWLSIGIQDLLSTDCSEEITLIGILRVVEELVARQDGSTIVINSLLPTTMSTKYHKGEKDSDNDKNDSKHFSTKYSGRHSHNEISKSITEINSKLASFASKHNGIKFFDATPYFLKSSTTASTHGTKYLKKDLYMDSYNLSPEGHLVWMTQQAQVIANIYKKKQEVKDLKGAQDEDGLEAWEPITHYSEIKPDHRYYDLDYYDYGDWDFEDDIF